MRAGLSARSLALSLAVMPLACGCAGEAAPDGPPWVAIGAGVEAFAPLADGGDIAIVMGPQGGYMVALALRAGGVVPGDAGDPSHPDNPRVTFRAYLTASGEVLGQTTLRHGLAESGDAWDLAGSWLIFNPEVATESYFDREMTLDVTVEDARGAIATDTVTVLAQAPTGRALPHLDVDPGEVVRRARDHAEQAARQVAHAQHQRGAAGGGRTMEAPDLVTVPLLGSRYLMLEAAFPDMQAFLRPSGAGLGYGTLSVREAGSQALGLTAMLKVVDNEVEELLVDHLVDRSFARPAQKDPT